ncbi:MAG: 4-hydroxy-tetrahydrodipicolinate reductase [Methanobrevibacter sp.]|uniref:4-hydroxy-tetrahydrodipicolinate reductase n=1 Tax=Methanobrevibacter millerae TaxID=230361 RepID=A0A8T3VF60_9EURY|nr:4-hydroxy-tetrahydrodipicolinate reductase [Methanobrevibacter millerae]MBE6505065.1 4-hydroxy-tetrahydrodipicolinate reductase [Methanobrevibacter millerae]MBR0059325.1 4-hydroxy-tetrahydrodipicolinate reductase [Methanobrevibacter sp.]MBR0369895.1 4-hydroxy-tetrahydrodipicolinate reductase [Methanobrevibacter sp.]
MIKVAVTGAAGRMGSGIIRKITEQDDMEVVAAIEIPNSPLAGKDAGLQAGIDELGVEIVGAEKLEETLKATNPDVLVDFTIAHAAVETIKTATACGVNIVVGTTGFNEEQMASNIKNVEDNNVGAVISSNMAIGVNVFFNTLKKLAPLLYDYDIEIIEAHHNQKKDAPSGTAVTAFEVIAESLERDPAEVGVYGRNGMVGKRTPEEIGIHAVRGGDIVGDHTVMFVGDGERLEVKHQAHTREVFIAGVIRAIRYAPTAEKGVVSSMNDVLGLE